MTNMNKLNLYGKITEEKLNELITKIAQKNIIGVDTLETRGMDSLDFHDVSVWEIRDALIESFISGLTIGQTTEQECTARSVLEESFD